MLRLSVTAVKKGIALLLCTGMLLGFCAGCSLFERKIDSASMAISVADQAVQRKWGDRYAQCRAYGSLYEDEVSGETVWLVEYREINYTVDTIKDGYPQVKIHPETGKVLSCVLVE